MSEETTFDEMGADLLEDLGQAATFTPAAGDAVSLYVDLRLETDMQPGGLDAQVWGSEATIEYLLEDIGREANAGETFTVDGTDYTVKHVVQNDGRFVTVAVK